MDSPGEITAQGDGKRPTLERILNRVFRCSHRQQTRPITLKGETFAICLDCGGHVPYSLDGLRGIPAGIKGPPVAKGKVEVKTAPVAPKKAAPVPKKAAAPIPVSRRLVHTVRAWTREGIWLGLAIGFAGGIYYSGQRHTEPEKRAVESPAPPLPKPAPEAIPAVIPSVPAIPAAAEPTPIKAAVKEAPPALPTRRPNQTPRLQSGGRFVLLAREAAVALDLSLHPGKLGALIHTGTLFTVARGTAVRVLERQMSVVHVVILEGPVAGQEGWVAAAQLQ